MQTIVCMGVFNCRRARRASIGQRGVVDAALGRADSLHR
jgi:hypothetical protein